MTGSGELPKVRAGVFLKGRASWHCQASPDDFVKGGRLNSCTKMVSLLKPLEDYGKGFLFLFPKV